MQILKLWGSCLIVVLLAVQLKQSLHDIVRLGVAFSARDMQSEYESNKRSGSLPLVRAWYYVNDIREPDVQFI